ncbi:MAG: membrane protein insertion efficiency factor YidD [Acidobacteria bacterium]|nr:membrane protein insertion efficiency factor YidD [Acidobacteriota bacterium]
MKSTTKPHCNAVDETPPPQPIGLAARGVIGLLRAYKLLISPIFTGCCRFYPSCADYMREAVETHGARRGVWLGVRRLAHCHPFGRHGVDPVPR